MDLSFAGSETPSAPSEPQAANAAMAPARATAPEPAAKGKKRKLTEEENTDFDRTCDACEVRPCKKKQKRCGECLAEIAACKRDATKSGKEAVVLFNSILKAGGPGLQDMLLEFKKTNPSRKAYQQHNKFDWIRYEKAMTLRKELQLGFKALMMDQKEAKDHWCEKKGLTRAAAQAEWDKQLAAAQHKDYEGREISGSRVRIPVKVEDFVVGFQAASESLSVVMGHKQQKFGAGALRDMREAQDANFTGFSDFAEDMNFDLPSSMSSSLLDTAGPTGKSLAEPMRALQDGSVCLACSLQDSQVTFYLFLTSS